MTRWRGFSLLEMLLVMVVASVLLSVALPAYQQAVIRAHRMAGKSALMEVASRQERYLMNHKRYSTSLAELGLSPDYFVGSTAAATGESRAVYRVELALQDGDFASFRAVPWNGQRRDADCGTLTLDRWGRRGALGAGDSAVCW